MAEIIVKDQVMTLPASLTFYDVQPLCESIPVIFPAQKTIEVDFSRVKHCDSASLLVILELMREAKKHHAKITFEHVPEEMKVLMDLYHLDKIIDAE